MALKSPFKINKKEENKYDNIIQGNKSKEIIDSNGDYKKEIKQKYSKEFLDLIDEMMNVNPEKRPKIEDILKKDIIIKRMDSFLEENHFNENEASTIIKDYQEKLKNGDNAYVELSKIDGKKLYICIESADENETIDYNNMLTQDISPAQRDKLKYNFQRQLSLIHKEQLFRRRTINL